MLCCQLQKKKKKNLLTNKLPCSFVADLKPWFLMKLSLHHAKVQLTGHNVDCEAFFGGIVGVRVNFRKANVTKANRWTEKKTKNGRDAWNKQHYCRLTWLSFTPS